MRPSIISGLVSGPTRHFLYPSILHKDSYCSMGSGMAPLLQLVNARSRLRHSNRAVNHSNRTVCFYKCCVFIL